LTIRYQWSFLFLSSSLESIIIVPDRGLDEDSQQRFRFAYRGPFDEFLLKQYLEQQEQLRWNLTVDRCWKLSELVCKVKPSSTSQFCGRLERDCPEMESLNLRSSFDFCRVLGSVLPSLNSLRSLTFTETILPETDLLRASLSSLPCLETLSVIGRACPTFIIEALPSFPVLTSVECSWIHASNVEILCQVLPQCKLTHLSQVDTPVQSLRALVDAVLQCPSLTCLGVRLNVDDTKEEILDLHALLAEQLTRLTPRVSQLHLYWWDQFFTVYLTPFCVALRRLKFPNLSLTFCHQLGRAHLFQLIHSLPLISGLSSLSLLDLTTDDEEVVQLISVLPLCTSLRHLSLPDRLRPKSQAKLYKIFEQTHLTVLEISSGSRLPATTEYNNLFPHSYNKEHYCVFR
jgi:hypothetical protein